MVKHSGWSQGRKLTRMQLALAAVNGWVQTVGRTRFTKTPRDFTHAKKRKRMVWKDRVDSLTDAEFKRTYRMTLDTFNAVLDQIRSKISRKDPKKSRRDLHGAVAAELQLSMTLRYLAGGSYLDIYQMHGVSRTTFYDTIPLVCFAIVEAFPLSFPVDDSVALVCGLIA
jgi:hypothetical protein